MDLDTFDQLLSPLGASAIAAASQLSLSDESFLNSYDKLRKRFPPALAKAAIDTLLLRAKGAVKFSHAARLYFTRESLEQSSSERVAAYRAKRFAPYRRIADICCGIGGDAMAFAESHELTAVDLDPLRCRMTAANLAAIGRTATILCGDALTIQLPTVDAAFCDPSRRSEGQRYLRLDDYLPPPHAVLAHWPKIPLAFKLAPGLAREELERYDGEAEFISLDGELKECVLWLRELQSTRRRATVLPSGDSLTECGARLPASSSPRRILYDPDSAVIRADLLAELAEQLHATPLDDRIALLSADTETQSPFATAFAIDEVLPFHAKRLGEALRERNVGRVTILKRGLHADVNELMKRWKLRGDDHRTIVLTLVATQPTALLVTPRRTN